MDTNSTISALGFFERITEPVYSKIVVAMLLLFIGLILGKFSGKAVKKLLSQVELNKLVRKAIGVNLRPEEIISSLVTYAVYFVFIIWALESIGISTLILNIFAIGVIAVIIISIFLGIKDFVPNLFAGIIIHSKDLVNKEDIIKSGTMEGKVVKVDLLSTRIETKSKDLIFIPNSLLLRDKFVKKRKKKHWFLGSDKS
jgi:small conductance mechanosensitive channel